jgi:DNA invertase Pin-like site-specific DNA recombinase
MSKGQRVGYIRVSSLDQSLERQLDGVQLDRTFTDKASGKDTRRPQLQAAMDYVRDGDTLIVHSMDRLARNAEDLLRVVRELTERGVAVEFVKNQLRFSVDRSNPMEDLMLTMLAGFAQFERSLIRERQMEGIALAKAKGKYKGRKRALSTEQVLELHQLASQGLPKADLARAYGISRETVYQYLRKS